MGEVDALHLVVPQSQKSKIVLSGCLQHVFGLGDFVQHFLGQENLADSYQEILMEFLSRYGVQNQCYLRQRQFVHFGQLEPQQEVLLKYVVLPNCVVVKEEVLRRQLCHFHGY